MIWGDRFQVNSKVRIDYYHKKGFEKKNLVYFWIPQKLQIIRRMHQQRTLMWPRRVRVGGGGVPQLPSPSTNTGGIIKTFPGNESQVLVAKNTTWGHGKANRNNFFYFIIRALNQDRSISAQAAMDQNSRGKPDEGPEVLE